MECSEFIDGRCRAAEALIELAGLPAAPAPVLDRRGCDRCLAAGGPHQEDPTVAIRSFAAAALSGEDREALLRFTRAPNTGSIAGVGQVLSELIASIGLKPRKKCRCRFIAAEMDRLGPDGCEREAWRLSGKIVESYRASGGWTAALATMGLAGLAARAGAAALVRKAARIARDRLGAVDCVVPLFNPAGYSRRSDNYARAIEHYRGLGFRRVMTVEAVYPGQQSQALGDSIVIDAHDGQRLWQKERLINLAIDALRDSPPVGVAWLDADLEFPAGNLAERIAVGLKTSGALQPFASVDLLGPRGERMDGRRAWQARKSEALPYATPGFAWAARWGIVAGGLWDSAIVGGGDLYTLNGWTHGEPKPTGVLPARMRAAWERWKPRERVKLGCLSGVVRHHFHGSHKARRYDSRMAILRRHDFDPAEDLRIGDNGLWEFTGAKAALARDVLAYFKSRREDA